MNQIKTPTNMKEFVNLITKWNTDNFEGFADKFKAAVNNVNPLPDGSKNPWLNADVKYLCSFFQEWYKWGPDVSTGLEKIQEFSWLYYENKTGLDFVTTNPGALMTYYFVVINGKKMDDPAYSKVLIDKWIKELGDKMKEYIVPEGGYTTFNQFFTRQLKPGERPVSRVNDDSVVVSSADAIVNMIDDNLSIEAPLDVKTQKLNVLQLLDNSQYAKNFEGGTAVSCILMPDVYHRYHSPVSGKVVESNEDVAGNYFGIDDFPKLINGGNVGYGYDYSVFEHFRRGYLVIETENYGYIAMIPVGLNTIATVIFEDKFKKIPQSDKSGPVTVYKGEEVGYFQYGSSLNILLFEKGCFPAIRIPQGQIIGTLNEKSKAAKDKTQFSF